MLLHAQNHRYFRLEFYPFIFEQLYWIWLGWS